MTRAAILPGTYDPITCGHTSLACRAAALFGRAVVVVMNNTEKRTLFSFEERLALARAAFAGRADVEVVGCAGLLADFAADYGDAVLVKGVRDARDFSYEANLAEINRRLGGVETLLLPADPAVGFISSTFVRELIKYHKPLTGYVPDGAIETIKGLKR